MKNLGIVIFLILIFSTINLVKAQQEPSAETKAYILSMIQSDDYFDRSKAIGEAIFFNVPEIVPILEQTIWQQGRSLAYDYIYALYKYNSPNFVTLAHQFINRVDTLKIENAEFTDSLEMKVNVTSMLFNKGDYSTASYVFELIERDKPKTFNGASQLLEQIIKNLPEYESEAKQELLRIAYLNDIFENYKSINVLLRQYSEEVSPILENAFLNFNDRPNDRSVRSLALNNLLKLNYPNLDELMRSRLIEDSAMTIEIAENLLEHYPSSENYQFIRDHLNQINTKYKTSVIYTLIAYEYQNPDTSKSLSDLLDDLSDFTDTTYNNNWLEDLTFKEDLKSILQSAKINLINGDSLVCREEVKSFQDSIDYVYRDSLNIGPRFVTSEGWQFLYSKSLYILNKLPEPQSNPNLIVSLKNSTGTLLTTGSLQYYDQSWKDATNNGDGTFTVITNLSSVSLRMTYEYGSQTVNNIPAQNNIYTFQTVNAAVQLKNSSGNLIDVGTVQYYAGAWRSFGITSNGVASKELLPVNYSFRMTYEYGSIDKQQNLSIDPTVIFQTVNAAVQLQNSQGALMDQGTVQYYAGAWRSFGTTSNGVVAKELLPVNYSFRMTYEYVSKDKQQNISSNPTVIFSTVLCTIKVNNTQGEPINNADVKYYAGAWRNIGLTTNGEITKELLPANIMFRGTFGTVHQDKQQDISINNIVEIILNVSQ